MLTFKQFSCNDFSFDRNYEEITLGIHFCRYKKLCFLHRLPKCLFSLLRYFHDFCDDFLLIRNFCSSFCSLLLLACLVRC